MVLKNKNTTVYDLNVDDIAVNSNIKVKFLERFVNSVTKKQILIKLQNILRVILMTIA
ncbi:MAG: hypothetical protein CM15mP124_4280 [Alphaproteobacteria bacterium]|nr:MAG: hypothetical protein CM15mP124_4280 [Alphaproteobacteria bacterium]